MKVSATAAAAATNHEPKPDSPALSQLKAAIEANPGDSDAATAILDGPDGDFRDEVDEQADTEKDPDDSLARDDKPDPPAYDPLAEVEAKIAACGERIVAHSVEVSELKAAIKAARRSWKTASDEQVELFHRKADILLARKNGETAKPEWPAATSTEDLSVEVAGDWRDVKLATLPGLTPKILEILAGNNVHTMGDFADVPKVRGIEYTQLSFNGTKLTEARFGKVQEALSDYWKRNPAVPSCAICHHP